MARDMTTQAVARAELRLMRSGQFQRFSPVIRDALRRASPAWVTDAALTNVMASIQGGARQAWLLSDSPEPDTSRLLAVLITRILNNQEFSRRTLYVDGLSEVEGTIPPAAWVQGLDALVAYAHREGCQTIECDTTNTKLTRLLDSLGFKPVSIRYQMEVPE